MGRTMTAELATTSTTWAGCGGGGGGSETSGLPLAALGCASMAASYHGLVGGMAAGGVTQGSRGATSTLVVGADFSRFADDTRTVPLTSNDPGWDRRGKQLWHGGLALDAATTVATPFGSDCAIRSALATYMIGSRSGTTVHSHFPALMLWRAGDAPGVFANATPPTTAPPMSARHAGSHGMAGTGQGGVSCDTIGSFTTAKQ